MECSERYSSRYGVVVVRSIYRQEFLVFLSSLCSNRLQPSPGNIHSARCTRGELLEGSKRRIQIRRLATRTAIYYFQIYTPLCSIFFVVSARSEHHITQWIVVAVASCARRRTCCVENIVRDRHDVVGLAIYLTTGSQAGFVVCQISDVVFCICREWKVLCAMKL